MPLLHCAPPGSVCEAGAPQDFLYVFIPSTFSSLSAQAARKIFLECKLHHVTFYEPLPWLHTAVWDSMSSKPAHILDQVNILLPCALLYLCPQSHHVLSLTGFV